MAKKIVNWEAAGDRVTTYDVCQGKRIAEFEKRVRISERQPAVPTTAPRRNKSRK